MGADFVQFAAEQHVDLLHDLVDPVPVQIPNPDHPDSRADL